MQLKVIYNNEIIVDSAEAISAILKTEGKRMLSDVQIILESAPPPVVGQAVVGQTELTT